MIQYALDISNLYGPSFETKILIITNEDILEVQSTNVLNQKVKLKEIRGIMNYYYKTDSLRPNRASHKEAIFQ